MLVQRKKSTIRLFNGRAGSPLASISVVEIPAKAESTVPTISNPALRKRGRPATGRAKSSAQRQSEYREKKRQEARAAEMRAMSVAVPAMTAAVQARWDELVSLIQNYRETCSVQKSLDSYIARLLRWTDGIGFWTLPDFEQIGQLNKFFLDLKESLLEHAENILWRRENAEAAKKRRQARRRIMTFDEFMQSLEEDAQVAEGCSWWRRELRLKIRELLHVKVPKVKTGLVTCGDIEKVDAMQNQR